LLSKAALFGVIDLNFFRLVPTSAICFDHGGSDVLIALVKKWLRIKASLYEILQILSLTLFEKTELLCLFQNAPLQNLPQEPSNQLNLFD
jgi:hypothetical protein